MSYPNGLRRLPRPFVISSQAALAASHSRAMRTHARVIVGFFRVFDRVALPQPSEAGSHQRIVPDALSGALRSDPRIGAANSKCSAFQLLITHSNRVSSNQSLRCRDTKFSGQRQRGRNGFEGSRTPLQRQDRAKKRRQFGASLRELGNLL